MVPPLRSPPGHGSPLSSALPTLPPCKKKEKAFLCSAGLLLNLSHAINPPNAADPQRAVSTQLEEEPATAWEQPPGLQGWKHPLAPLPQRPSEHTLGLSTGSFCAFALVCQDTFCNTSLITWFVALEVATAAKGTPKGLRFPRLGSKEQLWLLFMLGWTGQPGSHHHCHPGTEPGCDSWPPPHQAALPGTLPCNLKSLCSIPLPTPLLGLAAPKPTQTPRSTPCPPSCPAASVFRKSWDLRQHKG